MTDREQRDRVSILLEVCNLCIGRGTCLWRPSTRVSRVSCGVLRARANNPNTHHTQMDDRVGSLHEVLKWFWKVRTTQVLLLSIHALTLFCRTRGSCFESHISPPRAQVPAPTSHTPQDENPDSLCRVLEIYHRAHAQSHIHSRARIRSRARAHTHTQHTPQYDVNITFIESRPSKTPSSFDFYVDFNPNQETESLIKALKVQVCVRLWVRKIPQSARHAS